jgi:cold shock CspA family protein
MTSNNETHLVGRVKWFNNKAGYGFITVTDGTSSGNDIFVHHSAIQVDNQQYKYLVQGEYVNFDLIKTTSTDHEWQASAVNGINGGKLMCETRLEYKLARNSYKSPAEAPRNDAPRSDRPKNDAPRNEAPRNEAPKNHDSKKEWTIVSKKVEDVRKPRGRPPRQSSGN